MSEAARRLQPPLRPAARRGWLHPEPCPHLRAQRPHLSHLSVPQPPPFPFRCFPCPPPPRRPSPLRLTGPQGGTPARLSSLHAHQATLALLLAPAASTAFLLAVGSRAARPPTPYSERGHRLWRARLRGSVLTGRSRRDAAPYCRPQTPTRGYGTLRRGPWARCRGEVCWKARRLPAVGAESLRRDFCPPPAKEGSREPPQHHGAHGTPCKSSQLVGLSFISAISEQFHSCDFPPLGREEMY